MLCCFTGGEQDQELVTAIPEQKWLTTSNAYISGINLHGSDVVLPSPALWQVTPVASLDLFHLRLSLLSGVGQHTYPQHPVWRSRCVSGMSGWSWE